MTSVQIADSSAIPLIGLILRSKPICQGSENIRLTAGLRLVGQAFLCPVKCVKAEGWLQPGVPTVQLLNLHSIEVRHVVVLENV